MKRNDSLLSKLYYQALPKAKEGGNYFNKYKVPVNNTPEKRVDPILKFSGGGDFERFPNLNKLKKSGEQVYKDLPGVTVYGTIKKDSSAESLPKANASSIKKKTVLPQEQIIPTRFTPSVSADFFRNRKTVTSPEQFNSYSNFASNNQGYDISAPITKTTVPSAYYQQQLDRPLINTGRKGINSQAQAAAMMQLMNMSNGITNDHDAYINMLEQTDPEKAALLRFMNTNALKQQQFFNGGFLMPAQEGGNINFPSEMGYRAPRMADGGGLLSRTVTCSSCGHSWKGVTGGTDPLTCHNCGGAIKMANGGDISIADLRKPSWLKKFIEGGEEGPKDPPTSDAERQFIINWNNSPMAQQMLQASVDKDDPWGRNSVYVKDITNARNNFANKAQIKLLSQDQLVKEHDLQPGASPAGPGLGGFAISKVNIPKAVGSALLNMVTTPFLANAIGNNKAYGNVDLSNVNTIQPKIYTNKDNLDQILETNLHELSHASDFGGKLIPDSDVKKMDVFARGIKGAPSPVLDKFQQYVADPTETRARLMNFRYNAANQKLYDPFKEKINLDQLNNYKTTPGGFDPLYQLREVYSDPEILNLLNSVSKTDNGQQQTTAKYGGASTSWLNKYDDGGFATTETTTLKPSNSKLSPLNFGLTGSVKGNPMWKDGKLNPWAGMTGITGGSGRPAVTVPKMNNIPMANDSNSGLARQQELNANYTNQIVNQNKAIVDNYKKSNPWAANLSDNDILQKVQIANQSFQNPGTITKAGPEEGVLSRAWHIASNPMTALSYKIKGQDIPAHFERGEKNILDHAVNIINPATYINSGASLVNAAVHPWETTKTLTKAGVNLATNLVDNTNAFNDESNSKALGLLGDVGNMFMLGETGAFKPNSFSTTGSKSFREMFRSGLSLEKPKQTGLEFMNSWYNNPAIVDRYQMFRNNAPLIDAKGNYVNWADQFSQGRKLEHAQASLEHYVPKTYRDLFKDKGWKEGLDGTFTSSGLSYGTPESIYTNRGLFPQLGKIGQESTTAHELTHLITKNGNLFNDVEKNALLSPFNLNNDKYLKLYGEHFQPSVNPLADNAGYYLKPTEIHARMNEARKHLGLGPEDVFTPAHYNKVAKDHHWFGMKKHIKDPQRMIQLMNNFYTPAAGLLAAGTVGYAAMGNDNQSNDMPQQKYGGSWLSKYGPGGSTSSSFSTPNVPPPAPAPQTGSNTTGPTFSNQSGQTNDDDKDKTNWMIAALGLGATIAGFGLLGKDKDKTTDQKKCPPDYEWDPKLQKCVKRKMIQDESITNDGNGKPLPGQPLQPKQPDPEGIAWNYNPNIQAQQIQNPTSAPLYGPGDAGVSAANPSYGMAKFGGQSSKGWLSKYDEGGDVSIYGRRNYSADTPTFFAPGGVTEGGCPPGWIMGPDGNCVQDPEARRALAKKSVKIARQHIADNKYFDVPENLQKSAAAEDEGAYGCIGGVCSIYTEAGVMSKPNWSNTDFALHAKEYGFPNKGYGLDQLRYLEPGDALQYYDTGLKNRNKQYPHHSQLFLGVNPDNGEYEFFDNYAKEMKSYSKEHLEDYFKPDNVKNLREYARIFKVNPYTADPVVTNPEAIKAMEERKKMIEWQTEHGPQYEYGIRKDSPKYKDQPEGMKKFTEWANKKENIDNLVRKLGVEKSIINDELLNTFGELGQENKWENRTFAGSGFGLEGLYEKTFKPKNKSIGPGQIKFNSIDPDLKREFNINSPKDLYDWDKVIPLMTAINIKNRRYMENQGENLSAKLMGTPGVSADNIKYGVGRWTPYMYRGLLTDPKQKLINERSKELDSNFRISKEDKQKLIDQYVAENLTPDQMKYFAKGSYADKVYRNIDENLETTLINEGQLQPVEITSTRKKKQAYGGSINNNWLNKYKS